MKVVILDDAAAVARYGADIFREQLQKKPASVFGLATGSTPLSLYRELIDSNRRGEVSFSQVRSFNLDEYMDLAPEHPQSYRAFMNREFFDSIRKRRPNSGLYYLPEFEKKGDLVTVPDALQNEIIDSMVTTLVTYIDKDQIAIWT